MFLKSNPQWLMSCMCTFTQVAHKFIFVSLSTSAKIWTFCENLTFCFNRVPLLQKFREHVLFHESWMKRFRFRLCFLDAVQFHQWQSNQSKCFVRMLKCFFVFFRALAANMFLQYCRMTDCHLGCNRILYGFLHGWRISKVTILGLSSELAR
jgi:hypothetical protein